MLRIVSRLSFIALVRPQICGLASTFNRRESRDIPVVVFDISHSLWSSHHFQTLAVSYVQVSSQMGRHWMESGCAIAVLAQVKPSR